MNPQAKALATLKRKQTASDNRGTEAVFHAAVSRYDKLVSIPSAGGKFIGKGRFVSQPVTVDLVGSIIGTGRMFLADVKRSDCKKTLYYSTCFKDREHQRRELVEQGQNGAMTGLLVESTEHECFFWISWENLLPKFIGTDWSDPLWVSLGPSNKLPNLSSIFAR